MRILLSILNDFIKMRILAYQGTMSYLPLPSCVQALLQKVQAPPRLVAHLILVHHVAVQIVEKLRELWPPLQYDQEAVLVGAATHDMGKVLYPKECVEVGEKHEREGAALLEKYGFPQRYIHFTWTHAHWDQLDVSLEDLLVGWADKLWKGKRVEDLEEKVVDFLVEQLPEERWSIFMKMDEMATQIAMDAEERLLWQSLHPV